MDSANVEYEEEMWIESIDDELNQLNNCTT
jgi:hypothetical protein